MSTDNSGRKDKIMNSFLDTGTDSVIQWGNKRIATDTPEVLDWVLNKVKEVFSSVANASNVKSRDFIRSIIFQGIEIGEGNKENALVNAMKEVGLDESQIERILEASKKYLVTKEDVDSSLK
jgi:hypothetical protein